MHVICFRLPVFMNQLRKFLEVCKHHCSSLTASQRYEIATYLVPEVNKMTLFCLPIITCLCVYKKNGWTEQVSIPVGCVPPAFLIPVCVWGGGGCLPTGLQPNSYRQTPKKHYLAPNFVCGRVINGEEHKSTVNCWGWKKVVAKNEGHLLWKLQ